MDQTDPEVTGDQPSSHPPPDLHNAAHPGSDYEHAVGGCRTALNLVVPDVVPGLLLGPLPNTDAAFGQDSEPSPPSRPRQEMPPNFIHDASYPASNYRTRQRCLPSASLASYINSASAELASAVINSAPISDSGCRPSTVYSGASPGPPPNRCPLPCPKHLESRPSSQTHRPRRGRSSAAAGPSGVNISQLNGCELPPPPPYQPPGVGGAAPPSRPPHTQNRWPFASQPRQKPARIPMTTFAVHQNAIGHVAQRSNVSSALAHRYKEYDRMQVRIDDENRRRSRRKWLIGTLIAIVLTTLLICVAAALLKYKVITK